MSTTRARAALLVLCLLAFLEAGAAAASPDETVAAWIRSWDAPWLEEAARLGEAPVHLGVVLVLLAAAESDTASRIVEAEVGAAGVTWAGKVTFGRARPWAGEGPSSLVGPTLDGAHHSFPSGHTSSAFALATVLAGRYPRWSVLWYGLAAGVGLSRIYTEDHWPSDVLVGAAVGHLAGRAARDGRPWFGFHWTF